MIFDKGFEFKGKHADYCRFLKDKLKLFNTYREIYSISTIIGFLNSNKKSPINNKEIKDTSVFPEQIIKKRKTFINIYRLIMLLDENKDFNLKDYQNRTFRDDSDKKNLEKVKKNMEIFNQYAYGGLGILYSHFKDSLSTKDTIDLLYEYINEFLKDNNLIETENNNDLNDYI